MTRGQGKAFSPSGRWNILRGKSSATATRKPATGKTLRRWDTLAHLANTLRDLEGEIYRDLVGGPNIQLELMRIMHRQFVWQQQRFNWTWIIRYYKLFNTPALTAHAEQATGLSIDQIYLIGMCYLGHFFERAALGPPRSGRDSRAERRAHRTISCLHVAYALRHSPKSFGPNTRSMRGSPTATLRCAPIRSSSSRTAASTRSHARSRRCCSGA